MSDTKNNAADTPSIKKLLELAKLAAQDKNFSLEKSYLDQALQLDSKNPKVLRALAKVALRENDLDSEIKWLEQLLNLKPDGKILHRLIQIAITKHDLEWEKQLLLQKQELEPDNKKIPKKLKEIEELLNSPQTENNSSLTPVESIAISDIKEPTNNVDNITTSTILSISTNKGFSWNVNFDAVSAARDFIYDEEIDINVKESEIKSILESETHETNIFVLSELYTHINLRNIAQQSLKEHKRSLDSSVQPFNLKLTNKVLELVSNKKTIRGTWNSFWYAFKKFIESSDELIGNNGLTQNSNSDIR